MSGSGNDFVFFDNRDGKNNDLADPSVIGILCDRRRGVGADGIVLIDSSESFAFGMRYYNRDGSLAEMCGNAALCSATLARELEIVGSQDFTFDTTSGGVTARFINDLPEVDMVPVTELLADFPTALEPRELRIGFARVGVPHLVVHCEDATVTDVVGRGRQLRRLPELRDGANVNFVSRTSDSGPWILRTYERGVEDETLACGTGTVATAALLKEWGLAPSGVDIRTRSGLDLYAGPGGPGTPPVLRGEGRVVYRGQLG